METPYHIPTSKVRPFIPERVRSARPQGFAHAIRHSTSAPIPKVQAQFGDPIQPIFRPEPENAPTDLDVHPAVELPGGGGGDGDKSLAPARDVNRTAQWLRELFHPSTTTAATNTTVAGDYIPKLTELPADKARRAKKGNKSLAPLITGGQVGLSKDGKRQKEQPKEEMLWSAGASPRATSPRPAFGIEAGSEEDTGSSPRGGFNTAAFNDAVANLEKLLQGTLALAEMVGDPSQQKRLSKELQAHEPPPPESLPSDTSLDDDSVTDKLGEGIGDVEEIEGVEVVPKEVDPQDQGTAEEAKVGKITELDLDVCMSPLATEVLRKKMEDRLEEVMEMKVQLEDLVVDQEGLIS